MPNGPCVLGAVMVPSSSFQRLWPRVGRFACASFGIMVVLLLAMTSVSWSQTDVISGISVTGNRRIPADTIKARIFTKAGMAGPLALLLLIPGVGGLVVLCVLAFGQWRVAPVAPASYYPPPI